MCKLRRDNSNRAGKEMFPGALAKHSELCDLLSSAPCSSSQVE